MKKILMLFAAAVFAVAAIPAAQAADPVFQIGTPEGVAGAPRAPVFQICTPNGGCTGIFRMEDFRLCPEDPQLRCLRIAPPRRDAQVPPGEGGLPFEFVAE